MGRKCGKYLATGVRLKCFSVETKGGISHIKYFKEQLTAAAVACRQVREMDDV